MTNLLKSKKIVDKQEICKSENHFFFSKLFSCFKVFFNDIENFIINLIRLCINILTFKEKFRLFSNVKKFSKKSVLKRRDKICWK